MSGMSVMVVHNAYRQAGGEDGVVAAELALLRGKGHEVVELRRDNDTIDSMSRLGLATQTLWSGATHAQALALLRQHRPTVVHVHNTLPLVSPSLYWACAKAGVPVVQPLHNFRLACPQAMFLRDGKVCERCLGRAPWPALVHGCYRESRTQTAVVAGMLVLHRGLRTFEEKVTRYIALNEFCRAKFIQAGLPAQRIVVKPNFADMARAPQGQTRRGFLFVGRLSAEKGVETLGHAWQAGQGMQLRVVGIGLESARLDAQPGIEMLGSKALAQVQDEMHAAMALVVPSICHETFGLVVVEAYSCGLPVIASRIGALAELVEHGKTGLLFEPGDAQDLARTLRWAQAHPVEMAAMGAHARARYEGQYTPDINYGQLLAIYRSAIDETAQHATCETTT